MCERPAKGSGVLFWKDIKPLLARLLPRLCVPAALAFLASRLFMLEGLRYLNSYYEKLFEVVSFLLFAVTTCMAIIILVIQVIRRRPIEPGPLLFALGVGLFMYFAPLSSILIDYNFITRLPERTRFVEDILAKKITLQLYRPNDNAYHVPSNYREVSNSELILMEPGKQGPNIFFYFDSWIIVHFTGFMYRPDDSEPQENEFFGHIHSSTRLAPHWFFVCYT